MARFDSDPELPPNSRMKRIAVAFMALLMPAIVARGGTPSRAAQIGDTYEIVRTSESEQQGSHGGSSSHDKDTIVERVIGLRAEGLELEYDLPKATTAEERASDWQFPARVFKPLRGPARLLNGPELEARIDNWLKAARLSRSACGHWIFTWNAFRIECDPQSVIKTIQGFDLGPADLHEGDSYPVEGAIGPGTLARKAAGGGTVLAAQMSVDPDAVRRARAESDVVVGEIMHKPVSIDAALGARAKETISGTISVRLETDSSGNMRRRIKVTKLNIVGPGDLSETETVTETLERRLVSPAE